MGINYSQACDDSQDTRSLIRSLIPSTDAILIPIPHLIHLPPFIPPSTQSVPSLCGNAKIFVSPPCLTATDTNVSAALYSCVYVCVCLYIVTGKSLCTRTWSYCRFSSASAFDSQSELSGTITTVAANRFIFFYGCTAMAILGRSYGWPGAVCLLCRAHNKSFGYLKWTKASSASHIILPLAYLTSPQSSLNLIKGHAVLN